MRPDDDVAQEGRPRYSQMSDQELIEDLLAHFENRSWTLGHFIELERRGFDILDDHPELRDALTAEHDRMTERMRVVLEPLRQKLLADLAPLQERFRELAASFTTPNNFAPVLSSWNIDAALLPDFAWSETILRPASLPELTAPLSVGPTDAAEDEEVLEGLIAVQQEQWSREAELREAQLAAATSTALQLEVLREPDRTRATGPKRALWPTA